MSRTRKQTLMDNQALRNMLLKKGVRGSAVRQYVAGAKLPDALHVAKALAAEGVQSTLHFLAENSGSPEEIEVAMSSYREAIVAVSTFCPEAHVSVKLSAIGLTKDADTAHANLSALLEESNTRGQVCIRIDMEHSQFVSDTLDIVYDLFPSFPQLGAVVQSYLRRTDKDLDELIQRGISVRLVKGAYDEMPVAAYQDKNEIDKMFRNQMFRLIQEGHFPSIATHDRAMIQAGKIYGRQQNVDRETFEFEMLYGVGNELRAQLVTDKYNVRVYIPYGDLWFPYFTRRLAEHPNNTLFLLKNLLT